MKRNPWIDVLLVSAIFTLIVLIGLFTFISGDSKFQKSSVSASSPPLESEEIATDQTLAVQMPSDYKGIQIYKEISNDPSIPYTVLYPITEIKKINEEITQYINQAKEQYITAVRLNNNKVISDLDINLNIYEYKNIYYSLVFTKKQAIDGDHQDVSIQTFFFNKETGEIIDSLTLLNHEIHNLEKLSKYVYQKMLEPEGYKENVDIEKWGKATHPKWDLYNRFAVQNNSLVLYYDKGKVANDEIGAPTVTIPLSFINPILAPEFQSETKSDMTIITPVKNENPNAKRVALTFDDGPHETVTNQILTTLDKYHAKATFFMVGNRVERNASIVKEVVAHGHEIGNHTWNHPDLKKLSLDDALAQYHSTNNAIYNITGYYPTVFRPPYGSKNQEMTDEISLPTVLWTVDTLDWKYKNSSKLLPVIQNRVKNNSIILMHDIHQSTANGLDGVLAYLQQQGYEFVTVSELLAYQ